MSKIGQNDFVSAEVQAKHVTSLIKEVRSIPKEVRKNLLLQAYFQAEELDKEEVAYKTAVGAIKTTAAQQKKKQVKATKKPAPKVAPTKTKPTKIAESDRKLSITDKIVALLKKSKEVHVSELAQALYGNKSADSRQRISSTLSRIKGDSAAKVPGKPGFWKAK